MARSCSIWTPVLISLSPMTGESAKVSRRRVILATSVGSTQPLLEANIKEPQVIDSKDVSRRNTLLYLTAGVLCGVNLLHGEAAEARVGRKENRRKALEKLRGRAKESEPKSGDQKKKELDAEIFPLLPPPLQPQALGPVVEANLLP
ncbi:hypothetical protein Bca4012_059986 [Brassica carinata]|uniref:Uncharacterized protein n=1 Tax=Brassica carinata TaxID=52824 RepID=A0A8X7SD45_BRACI|nr:hypothetical protein Bca52824_030400 [Brassica carinata]